MRVQKSQIDVTLRRPALQSLTAARSAGVH